MASIISIFQTIKLVIEGVNSIISFVKESRQEAWFQDWSKAMVVLRNAKTSEERQDAARKISDALGKL